MSKLKNVIVIGASAGGFTAITELLSLFPAEMPAAVFIVLHMSKVSSASVLQEYFKKHTPYPFHVANDGDAIEPGHIYLAPADFHILLKENTVKVNKGAHENRWRPSIDVLFRSAAATFSSRAIGIILSGMLDDGTSGMSAIKRSGGICIVQEPVEAEFPDMPDNVLNNVDVDHRVSIADMGYILDDIFSKPTPPEVPVPEEIKIEAAITERMTSDISDLAKIGERTVFICPDCGGGLWEMKGEKNPRYRCHTGHVYTGALLLQKQNEELEESLWVSIRMLEERRNLLMSLAKRENGFSEGALQEDQLRRANELAKHIERLKELLVAINKVGPPDEGYL